LVAGERAAAEDAVHEALARAWERSARGEQIESLPAWVTRVAMNLSKSRLRRLRVESRARQTTEGDDAIAEDAGERFEIGSAVAGLPRRQREVTVRRYFLGFDVEEIASLLRVSEGTVKTSLHRARHALAAALGDTFDEETDDARSR
jgi:RNA polymerase sigma factor (sigma-70 family)